MVLMLSATPGMTAPAATATNPAMSAYSIRSCPRVSFKDLNFKIVFFMTEDISEADFATIELQTQN